MRRAIFLVLAIVVALWLPVRHADVPERETSLPKTEGSTQTERPARLPDSAPQMVAGAPGAWHARLAHDVLASETSSPKLPDYSLWASVPLDRSQLQTSPPFRTFPLLI